VGEGEKQAVHQTPLIHHLSYTHQAKNFRVTGLNVLHADQLCALRLLPRCATPMKSEWDIESAIATYNVEGWGEG
jgi:hypothetical protein